MLERELKFHVPPRQRTGLKARLHKLGAEPAELHARYYDTENQVLARAHIALRLRREDGIWIQTIKTPGPDELSRVEWNHPRPGPTLDLGLYADTHIGALMANVAGRLRCRYITHVIRLKKVVPTGSGSAELAYDEGAIVANGIELPIHEFEIEGVSGEARDLFALSREWLWEHRLVLELRSKAARGDAIASLGSENAPEGGLGSWDPDAPPRGGKARGMKLSPQHIQRLAAPVRAGQPLLSADTGIHAAYLECANDCMSQIIRNSGFLAGLDSMKTSNEQRIEYVHQIRVGIRRLRACWQLFGAAANPPESLRDMLKQHFAVLGQARDLDVIQTELLPRLMKAGMPPDATQAPIDHSEESTQRARKVASPEFQQALLDLLEHLVLYGDALRTTGSKTDAAPLLCRRLNIWLERIRRDARSFVEASWDARHDLRKRVKRLRYGMEFSQGILDTTQLTPLRNALVSAQKALGQLNDLYVAAEYYRGPGAKHPSAMFALGWLAATQDHEAMASDLALQELSKAGRFQPVSGKNRKRKRA
ncbi:CYTH and CHAD domain-containing protein [Alcaligenaceae bacterium]|nr:CYTH and CHAD domain-containing protein [Alcaligenaceae bacterium]